MAKCTGMEKEIEINRCGIGDLYAKAFSKSLQKLPKVTKLDLNGNRLAFSGINRILKNLRSDNLIHLDLTDNRVNDRTIKLLIKLIQSRNCALQTVNLEATSITSNSAIKLFETITWNKTITSLNISNNRLPDQVGFAIAELLKENNTLVKLDLNWNMFNWDGADEIFIALQENKTLKELDMSFNALGSKRDSAVIYMCEMFRTNTTLLHIDLSCNNFTKDQIDTMALALESNHTILGIHVIGNECEIDSKGFLRLSSRPPSAMRAHIMTRVINKPKVLPSPRTFNNCWLCEKWQEVPFVWMASPEAMQDPIYLHLECDDYRPELMVQTHIGKFEITRVVPPGPCSFYFTYDVSDEVLLSPTYPSRTLDTPLTIDDEVYPGCVVTRTVTAVNEMEYHGNVCKLDSQIDSEPRHPSKIFPRPEVERPKTPWSIPISVFKNYVFDDDYHLDKCFEFDWKCSKIPRVVKVQEELDEVKEVLRRNYKYIRETYKYYSALGINGGMFCISSNAFTEFCNMCKIVDQSGFKLADIDLNMTATCYNQNKNNHRNPANALVRFEFMEILVRAAVDKYHKTNICQTAVLAMERLIEDMMEHMSKQDSNIWRWDRYICESVDLVFKAYKDVTEGIYKRYSGKNTKPGQKKFMCLEEFNTFCEDAGFCNDNLVQRDIDLCFNAAMITQVDELNSDRHFQMTYVEFLEAFGRIADKASLKTPKGEGEGAKDPTMLPLSRKIENCMPRLLGLCSQGLQEGYQYPESSPLHKKPPINRQTSGRDKYNLTVQAAPTSGFAETTSRLGEKSLSIVSIPDNEGKPSIPVSPRTISETRDWAKAAHLKVSPSKVLLP